jgi:feruloyl esterase
VGTAFTNAELNTVSDAIVRRCDALDGATDSAVNDVAACQASFQLDRDVPTCAGERNGSCLSAAQKTVLSRIFAGVRNSTGQALYADWPFDPGVRGSGWRQWKFSNAVNLSPGAAAFVFATPPQATQATFSPLAYAMKFNVDTDAPKIFASNATYTEPSMSFMTPPAGDLAKLRNRGAKLMIYHGVGDPTFSFNDTVAWYQRLRSANNGEAADFARLYPIPGMNHCSGGPATDSFDMLNALVGWVEQGVAPDRVLASARAGNTELPPNWSPTRTRPLCPWPKVARYAGTGDVESAANFRCE